jgi:predicted ATP-grasp superfamily ATP-dependent carboligase
MRVFICEYVTSGGLRDKPLPETLLPAALQVRDALIRDLETLPGISTILAYDDRLPKPSEDSVPVGKGDDAWICWSGLAHEADVVWPVGPETGGVLARMVRLMNESAERLIASSPAAIDLVSSKLRTAQVLAQNFIPHVPTYTLDTVPADLKGDLITKPDDGAGSENMRAWPSREALPRTGRLVVQPFVHGTPVSLTVLVRPDGVTLLAANQLHMSHLVGVLSLTGVTVGAIDDTDGTLAVLAQKVVAAVPGLSGIIGIDVILSPSGPLVVEVNPRVTVAYAGLHAALGISPAAFLPELIRDGRPPAMPHLPRPRPVELDLR